MAKHPWIEKYPIKPESKFLIIGTHPPLPYCGKLEFFYGNMNEFWRFLDAVYPGNKLYNNGCPDIKDIETFLDNNKISISDIVEETSGQPFSIDSDMHVTKLNSKLKSWLEDSEVETIYFTSAGGKNNALSLFRKWVKKNYPKSVTIPDHKVWMKKGYNLQLGERRYLLELIYSPSPTARRGIKRSLPYIEWCKKNNSIDIDEFRIEWYKNKLPNVKS